jgi:predicted Fe-Mo cluster-binding NifX family protein
MRIAVPISGDWIAPVFDEATRLLIVDIGPGRRPEQSELPTFVRPPDQRAAELESLGVDMLVCDEISDRLARFIRARGIEIRVSMNWAVADLMSFLADQPHLRVRQPALAM